MEYRLLGRTGVKVSRLAMGTMSFGGDADEAAAAAMFARCRDIGINTFDTADAYSGGRSEEILGRLIREERDEIVLCSKAYFPTSEDVNARGSTRYHLVRAVEASLRRLGTDRVDVYFLHRFDDVTDLEETLRAVEQLVRSGKILYPAVSNFSAWQTAKALGLQARLGFAPFACVQPMYNLVKRQAEVEILPMAVSEGLGVLTYSPLAAGLLTGRYGVGRRPARGRLVDSELYGVRYGEPSYAEVAERFTALAAARGVHPVSLAVAWVAAHPAVTAPLVGARSVAQLEPSLAALDVPMDDELYAAVTALAPSPPLATDRNEETVGLTFGAR